MEKYVSINRLLSQELEDYTQYLLEEIYDDDEELEVDEYYQIMNGDDRLEKLYCELLKYVNIKTNRNFKYNNNYISSLMCKSMIMAHYFEYISCYYDEIDDINKQIYIRLCDNLNFSNAIKIFNNYARDIIEMHDFILSIYINSPEILNSIRYSILSKNMVKDVIKINPASIFDYRFLMGLKFDNEDIPSITIGNILKSIVDNIYINDMSEVQTIGEIKKLLDYDSDILNFVTNNKSYMISNIYEHLKIEKNKTINENKLIKYIENNDVDDVLNEFVDNNYALSWLLYYFNKTNINGLTEDENKNLIDKMKKIKKYDLIVKYNPYYLEEEQYFKNRGV